MKISKVVARDVWNLYGKGYSLKHIAHVIGLSEITVRAVIESVDSMEDEPPKKVADQSMEGRVIRLGRDHANFPSLSRVAFLDYFKVGLHEVRENRSGGEFYYVYLDARARASRITDI